MHLDSCVILGDDADIVLNDSLSKILPAGVSFRVVLVWGGGEDVGGAEVTAEALGDDGPAHEFRDGKGFNKFFFFGDEGVAGVRVDAVEEVGLFVVMRGEEDVVDDSLEDLDSLDTIPCQCKERRLTACSCSGFSSTDSVSRTCR